MSPPFVYITGYPGIGKLTVARELSKLIPKSKILNNHHLIDPVAMVYDRKMPEYQPLRQAIRTAVLTSIAQSESTADVTWICTDQQSSNARSTQVAQDYQDAATLRGSRFLSVTLSCEAQENEKRLVAEGRGRGENTKLTDLETLRMIRNFEIVFRFSGDDALELDVTKVSAQETAKTIFDFVESRVQVSTG